MDIIKLRIPYAFFRSRGCLSWQGIRFGLENELIDPMAPHEFAVDQVGEVDSPTQALLDLASSDKNCSVYDLVSQLAAGEPEFTEVRLRDHWLYLVLAWIYEGRADYADPLQKVEEVYADFDYPERIANFVRYMPMEGADLGGREANENRLFRRWRQYLDEVGEEVDRGRLEKAAPGSHTPV